MANLEMETSILSCHQGWSLCSRHRSSVIKLFKSLLASPIRWSWQTKTGSFTGSEPVEVYKSRTPPSTLSWARSYPAFLRRKIALCMRWVSRLTLQWLRSTVLGLSHSRWPTWRSWICAPLTRSSLTTRLTQCWTNFPRSGTREKVSTHYSFTVTLVLPPYIDVISKHFSSNTMRKPAAYVPLLKKGATTSKPAPQSARRWLN